MRKLIFGGLAAAVAAAAIAIGAQAQDNPKLDELREQGFARIAIANEPPFTSVAADGKVSGAAPDVARVIFERLGVPEVVASISEYGAMIPGLQARRHDAVTAGLFMRPERCEAVAYSEPVLCDAEAFLLKAGNPKGLNTFAAIPAHADATIGGDAAQAKQATHDLTSNASQIAKFLSDANPHLPRQTLESLLAAHGAHHVQQNQQLARGDRANEARTWDAMRTHIYSISDALTQAIAKQFPDKFR